MLIGADFNLPENIVVHGFLTVNKEKMSKSRGTFFTAEEFASKYNPEYLRFYYSKVLSKKLADIDLEFKIPAPTHIGKFISVKSVLENPPIALDAFNNEATKQSATVIERLKHIPPGKNAWYEGIPEHLRMNVKGAKMSQIYKRLHPDKPSYTITGSGGGGTHGYHWSENRALTNRERARIQTFPDDFVFEGSKEDVRKQIGMAVPPKAAKIIVEAILKTFAGIPYKWVPAKVSNGNGKK